jgi:hypothetical protein
MSNIGKRITALEGSHTAGTVVWHRILQQPGQSRDAALGVYGRQRIDVTDWLIVRQIVDAHQNGERALQ